MVFIGDDFTSVVPFDKTGISHKNSINQIMDLQDNICKLGKVYCLSIKKNAGVFASYLGSDIEKTELEKLIPLSMIYDICESFDDSSIESVVEYDTGIDYLKMTGFDIRGNHDELIGVGILIGIIKEKIPEDEFVSTYLQRTKQERYDKSVELFASVLKHFFHEKFYAMHLEDELTHIEAIGRDLEAQLTKNEVLTNVLKLLESENDFAQISEDIIRETGKYLNIEDSFLVRTKADGKTVETIAGWTYSGEDSLSTVFEAYSTFDLPFMNGKTYTISSDTIMPEEFDSFFSQNEISAGVFLPIGASGKKDMYLCFVTKCRRKWTVEDLRFLNDVRRVLQTILIKRITKNSLASSYAALEAILQNVDCGICVDDVNNKKNLLENDSFNNMVDDEDDVKELRQVINGVDEEITHIHEYYLRNSDKWVDISFAKIRWVDGREARLTTVFDITSIKHYQEKIEHQACTDFLTGLYNRKQCEIDLQQEIRMANVKKMTGALMYLDLDDFKNINDGLGHRIGDKLLVEVSKALDSAVGLNNKCYRVGGDEFIVLISPEDFDKLEEICRNIKSIFSRSWKLSDAEYYCTMSMGYVTFPKNGSDVQSLMQRADVALSYAKAKGKNRIEAYSEQDVEKSVKRLDLEKCLREAVADDCREFEVYYQPVVDVTGDETVCCGAEALVRWRSKKFGFMNPAEFIPLAEYLGLIVPIGEHVLFEACKRCKYWNDFGHPEYKVNVNLSVVQLLQKDIVDTVRKALEVSDINPYNLTLEVTEGLAINDMESMKKILDGIKSLGVRVALDDFGTGYSSLNHIRSMPLDVIKIDRCFVNGVGDDAFSDAFVKTVSKLADAIDVNVCVEGVEEEKQKDALDSMNIQMIQGFLYDRPLPQDEFENKYLI